ncbi:MAG: ABC transporter ATP-binding protein [Ilumatobacter sp.]|uniref:ABC transporter ATP-binding protein n=1 Tax=Ilumatobacter sp. TaxID=1967498 RepID=UPI00262068BC|nr:ABC transporter ATP-binding protein [Ilumatobacter sp.]MDJ0767206.1 ABC transporter ATP-binding protein [Ilumatobacter sp.]
MTALIDARKVSRVYGEGATAVLALDGVDLEIPVGQFVALVGPSGSGKTTLLNMIGAMDAPTGGRISVDGVDLGSLDRDGLTAYRRDKVGFVFQFFNLVPTLTALENVELIARLTGDGAHVRSVEALAAVGLDDRVDHFPSQLSGGQQQRVAIARALAKQTPVLLCDEPTGALDRANGAEVLDLLQRAARDFGRTVIVVSHDPAVEDVADRALHLVDGQIVDDRRS